MKKKSLSFLALTLCFGLLVSCGGKTAEEIQAEAQKKFDDEKPALEQKAAADCGANTASLVQAAIDSMTQAKMANQPETVIN